MGKEKVQVVIDAKDNASKKIGRVRGALGGMASVASGMIAANVLTGVARGIAGLGTAAISVESAMAGVTKTTDGLLDEMGNLTYAGETLKGGFRDLAKEIPMSVEELMHIGELGGQLGIAEDSLLDFTRTIADLGVTTNLSTEDAAMSLAQLMNVMGTNQEDIDKLGSVIVDLGNNFATTEADIVGFASRIAGAGEIAGLTEADVMGISAAFSSVGIQAEAGGTAVQKVLMAMNQAVAGGIGTSEIIDNTDAIAKMQEKYVNATGKLRGFEASLEMSSGALQAEYDAFIAAGGAAEKWGEQLGDKNRRKLWNAMNDMQDYEQMLSNLKAEHGAAAGGDAGFLGIFAEAAGMSAAEFQTAWGADPAKAFQAFVEGLGAAGDDAINILEDLELKDQRLIRSFLSLSKAGDLLGDSIERGSEAWGENNALTKEAEQRYRTTAAQVEIFKNRIRDIAITIGDALLPKFNAMLSALSPVAEAFHDAITSGDWSSLAGALTNLWSTYISPTLSTWATKFWDWLSGEQGAMAAGVFLIQHRFAPQVAHAVSLMWPGIWAEISTWPAKFWEWLTKPESGALALATVELDKLITTIETWTADSTGDFQTLGGAIGTELVKGIGMAVGGDDAGRSTIMSFLGSLWRAVTAFDTMISAAAVGFGIGLVSKIAGAVGGDDAEKLLRDKLTELLTGAMSSALGLTPFWPIYNVIKNAGLMDFQSGGMIPGPIGAPQLAVVHGGEMVLNPEQQQQFVSDSMVNARAEIATFSAEKMVSTLKKFLGDIEKIGKSDVINLNNLPDFQSGGMIPESIGIPQLEIAPGENKTASPQEQQQMIQYNFNQTVNTRAEQSSVVQDFNMLKSLAGVA